MTTFRIAELRVGRACPFGPQGQPSAIDKQPVAEPLAAGPSGLAGDELGDPRRHGGLDKAIDFALTRARTKRYGHAAQHLATCADLARRIEDFASVETHAAYLAKLKQDHGRKSGFWGQVA